MTVKATPLVRIDTFGQLTIYGKLENLNPSGSVKYRTVSRMLDDAIASGELGKGMGVVEITSGNTGIALALRGMELGRPVRIITVQDATEEAKRMMRSYGAEVIETDGWFAQGVELVHSMMSKEPGMWYWTKQTSNPSSLSSNNDLGLEIIRQLSAQFNASVDVYAGSAETGSTLSGVARAFKQANPKVIVYRVVPKGEYRFAGVGEEGVSTVPLPLFDNSVVDRRLEVSEEEAIAAAKELATKYAHKVGVSAGADFAAARQLAGHVGGNCVIIFPDNSDRYPILQA